MGAVRAHRRPGCSVFHFHPGEPVAHPPATDGPAGAFGFHPVHTHCAGALLPGLFDQGFPRQVVEFCFNPNLFALGLSGLWASGQTEPQVIGGLLPTTDAGEYYFNALRFLNGSLFSDYASRRPLFSAFLSTVLFITEKNLQAALALMVALTAICSFFATMTIKNNYGTGSASLFLLLVFLFYRRFSGSGNVRKSWSFPGINEFFALNSRDHKQKYLSLFYFHFFTFLRIKCKGGTIFNHSFYNFRNPLFVHQSKRKKYMDFIYFNFHQFRILLELGGF